MVAVRSTITALVLSIAMTAGPFVSPAHSTAQDAAFEKTPAPDEKGPYSVGLRILENVPMTPAVEGGPPRLARVQVLYPTPTLGPPNCQSMNATYAIEDIGGTGGFYQLSSPLCAVQDANPSPGRFPLIVYDHGGGGEGGDHTRIRQLPLAETLASHGFVVAMARHAPTPRQRILDMSAMIDILLEPNSPLSGSVDPNRIGIAGHSTGGGTSLGATGGWAAQALAADSRFTAMVLFEPNRNNSLEDVATISIPYLVMSGTRFASGVVTVPELFDTTVLATPRIHVVNPEALHISYETNVCPAIDELREAALLVDPLQPEPLTNMITNPVTGLRACNPAMGPAAFRACTFWNNGETAFPVNGPGFGGGRNFCNRVGADSIRSLDVNPIDGFTDDFVPGTDIRLFQGNDQWNSNGSTSGTPLPGETLVPLVKLYTVAFFKKFLAGDGRYMRYLTPGYAKTRNLEAVVEIRK